MTLTNKIQLHARPEKIWDLIANPVSMKSWNPRLRAVIPVTPGKPKDGSQFRIRYELGGRESNYLAEIMEFREHARLVLHLTGGDLSRKGYIQEIYELSGKDSGTLLRQRIVIDRKGLNILSGLFLRFANRVGKHSGKKYLSRLGRLAETEAPE
jgi:hypothetical protein